MTTAGTITAYELEQAVTKLMSLLPPDKLAMLPTLIEQVITATGYGNISIVICDRRVELIKAESSYR